MKTVLSLAIFMLLPLSAQARNDATIYLCEPGEAANGLNIRELKLNVSNEDPEAELTVSYGSDSASERHLLDYDMDGDNFNFVFSHDHPREIEIHLIKNAVGWKAHVTSPRIDTFSILDCSELD